ncbi:MAG: hypothetical protein ACK51L_05165, partial [bacterium]
MNYVQTPPQNDNYVALIILSSTVVTTWHVGSSWSESRLNNCNYLSFLCLFREEENSEVIY